MVQLISFPPRLSPQGDFVTRADGDPNLYAEELAVIISTRPGERELVPLFGLSDPAFDAVDADELSSQVGLFGPPVAILSLVTVVTGPGSVDCTVSFDQLVSDGTTDLLPDDTTPTTATTLLVAGQ